MVKNQPLWVGFYILPASDEQAMKAGGEALVKANHYYTNGMFYTGDLTSQIDQNNVKLKSTLGSQDKKIQKIERLPDIDNLDNSMMPIVEGISFAN